MHTQPRQRLEVLHRRQRQPLGLGSRHQRPRNRVLGA